MAKRPRTIGRFSKEDHDNAREQNMALVHVEVSPAYLPEAAEIPRTSIRAVGPASIRFALAVREVLMKHMRGEYDDDEVQHG